MIRHRNRSSSGSSHPNEPEAPPENALRSTVTPMNVRKLFEDELRKHGFAFSLDPESGRHAVEIGGARLFVSLDILQRDVASDGDTGRISRFVDAIVASSGAFES